MAKTATVRRTLHLKFTAPSADPKHLHSLIQAARPFYEFYGGKVVKLLQNVDDPARFVQVIEYETDASLELNRQKLASDARWQTMLQMWRSATNGGVEMDIYSEVSEPK
jgi:hypothetical protein